MSEMIERVARAIFVACNADPDWDDGYLTREQAVACRDPDLSQQECRDLARAAILALREPTAAMARAGVAVADHADGHCGSDAEDDAFNRHNTVRRFQAMIDEALR